MPSSAYDGYDPDDYYEPDPDEGYEPDDIFWDDDLTGPEQTEPDFDAESAAEYAEHCDEHHGGGECDCPPPPPREPPVCRLLYRIPRWTPRGHWQVGTPGCCESAGATLRGALRWHRQSHTAPF